MQTKKIFLIILASIIIFSPALSLAQFSSAQQNYPNIGGGELLNTSASGSIPSLVKYLFNLVVWVCILVSVLVLILGGVQYVTSSGDVAKMSGAKTRIYGSLLGLTILIGAWFVLHTVNPSFVIPKITYVPIKQGIILFTRDGFKALYNAEDESVINDLIQGGNAFRLNYDLPDITKEFGELVVYGRNQQGKAIDLNFEKFELYAIGFWGTKNYNSIVTFYPQKNYTSGDKKNIRYFSAMGEVDEKGEPVIPSNRTIFNSKIKGLRYISLTETKESVEYFDVDKIIENPTPPPSGEVLNPVLAYPEERANLHLVGSEENVSLHPAMSLKIVRNAPGVYLVDTDGNEAYFDSSVNNFKNSEINFDQKAHDVKIINDVVYKYFDEDGSEKEVEEKNDFLAILHEGDNFSGNLKIYFEARKYDKAFLNDTGKTSPKAKDKFIPVFTSGGNPEVFEAAKPWFQDNGFKFPFFNKYFFGHLPTVPFDSGGTYIVANQEPVIATEEHSGGPNNEGIYGKILRSVSSINVYELADDETSCQEVRICTEKQGRGQCIAYIPKDSAERSEADTVFYPMPVYVPVNIPCPSSLANYKCSKPIFSIAGKNVEIDFDNNIKSIIIKGKCAAVLFENSVDYTVSGYWSSSIGPGTHSEVFTYSDYDLEDNQIGLCGSVGVFNRQIGRECASAIVVYPIK